MTYHDALEVLHTLYTKEEISALVGVHVNTVSLWTKKSIKPREYHKNTLVRLAKITQNSFSFSVEEKWREPLIKMLSRISAPSSMSENEKLRFRCKVYGRRCNYGDKLFSWLAGTEPAPQIVKDAFSFFEEEGQ
jgi:hypothetical protein